MLKAASSTSINCTPPNVQKLKLVSITSNFCNFQHTWNLGLSVSDKSVGRHLVSSVKQKELFLITAHAMPDKYHYLQPTITLLSDGYKRKHSKNSGNSHQDLNKIRKKIIGSCPTW